MTEAHQGTADAPGRGTVNDRPTDPGQAPALTRSADGRCARITLRRPAHRNRLHAEDLLALRAHFRAIDADPAIRVVVLDAQVQGPRPVFCAGYHLGEHGGYFRRISSPHLFPRFDGHQKPRGYGRTLLSTQPPDDICLSGGSCLYQPGWIDRWYSL